MGDYIVSHDLLRDYMKLFVGDGYAFTIVQMIIHSYTLFQKEHIMEAVVCKNICVKINSQRHFTIYFSVTLHSYYRKWYWTVMEAEGLFTLCNYMKLRAAWLSFLTLLKLDINVYDCKECGVQPKMIVGDGITLGFLHNNSVSQDVEKPTQPESLELSGCR